MTGCEKANVKRVIGEKCRVWGEITNTGYEYALTKTETENNIHAQIAATANELGAKATVKLRKARGTEFRYATVVVEC